MTRPGIGHKRPPGSEHRETLETAAGRIRAALRRLDESARAEAGRATRAFTDPAPWLYFPSRLAKCRRDREALARVEAAALERAASKRAPQRACLERKLARIEAELARLDLS